MRHFRSLFHRTGLSSLLRWTCILLFPVSALWSACEGSRSEHGEWLYNEYCANCHMEDGSGLRGLIPPLAGADYLTAHREKLACIVRYGMEGPIVVNGKTYNQPMGGIPEMNPVEITNILNYIHRSWGNDLPYLPLDSVRMALEACEGPVGGAGR